MEVSISHRLWYFIVLGMYTLLQRKYTNFSNVYIPSTIKYHSLRLIDTLLKFVYLRCSNVKSVLHALVQLTDNFPRHEPQNVNLQQQLALVRAKFKQVGTVTAVYGI